MHRGFGEEAEIRETLVWYQASVRYTEMLGNLSEWVLDYAKAAECIALLVRTASDISDADRRQLVDRAQEYLDRAREVVVPSSWSEKFLARVSKLLAEAGRTHGPS